MLAHSSILINIFLEEAIFCDCQFQSNETLSSIECFVIFFLKGLLFTFMLWLLQFLSPMLQKFFWLFINFITFKKLTWKFCLPFTKAGDCNTGLLSHICAFFDIPQGSLFIEGLYWKFNPQLCAGWASTLWLSYIPSPRGIFNLTMTFIAYVSSYNLTLWKLPKEHFKIWMDALVLAQDQQDGKAWASIFRSLLASSDMDGNNCPKP